ncbi:MAG: hypothetical protein IT164_12145 [Bryobacterales bacterium]|nr:hypothetical protein [Bryobacterales bacterium]
MVNAAGLLMATHLLPGQVRIDLRTQSRNVDFSAAATTKPFKMGGSLPAGCTVGETFFLTTAPAGTNLYGCPATNVWTQLGGSSVHTHPLTDLSGITGKHGSGSILQSYAGGTATSGHCAAFDAGGNLVDAGYSCGGGGGAITAGQGVVVAGGTVSIDDTVIPYYLTGTGAPAVSCSPGRDFYLDTATGMLHVCWATDLWRAVGTSTFDSSIVVLADEFASPAQAASSLTGTLGWAVRSAGTAGTITYQSGTWPSIGVVRLQTPATANSGPGIALDSGNTALFSNLAANAGWELRIRFRLMQTSNSRLRIGFFPAANTLAAPADGLYLRYDTSQSDTQFLFESRSGGSATTQQTGVAADTGWHTIQILSAVAGSVQFRLDSGTPQTISTGLPTGALTLGAYLVNAGAAAAGSVELDYVKFEARGVSR